MKQLLVVLCLACLPGYTVFGQDYYKVYFGNRPTENIPEVLLTRPQSLDDFIGRFNGMHNAYGKPLAQSDPAYRVIFRNPRFMVEFRRQIIGSLVAPALLSRDSQAVETFAAAAAQSKPLDFLTSSWWVEMPLRGKWKGKNIELILVLKAVADDRDRVRWVLTDAVFEKGKPTGLQGKELPVVSRPDKYIPPSAHDNGFIAVRRILQEERNLSHYTDKPGSGLGLLQELLQDDAFIPDFEDFIVQFRPNGGPAFQMNSQWQIIGI